MWSRHLPYLLERTGKNRGNSSWMVGVSTEVWKRNLPNTSQKPYHWEILCRGTWNRITNCIRQTLSRAPSIHFRTSKLIYLNIILTLLYLLYRSKYTFILVFHTFYKPRSIRHYSIHRRNISCILQDIKLFCSFPTSCSFVSFRYKINPTSFFSQTPWNCCMSSY